MSSDATAVNCGHCPDKVVVAVQPAANLLAAGSEGHGDEVVQILEVNLELLGVGDLNGDTVFHLLVSGGYVKPLFQLLKFMLSKNPELLKKVAKQGNANGDTPLHLALKKRHNWIANLLGKVEKNSISMGNDDGQYPYELAYEICRNHNSLMNKWASPEEEREMQQNEMLLDEICNALNTTKSQVMGPLEIELECCPMIGLSDLNIDRKFEEIVGSAIYEGKILEMLEVDPNLIRYKSMRGETILHVVASSGDLDVLTKFIGHLDIISRVTRPNDQSQLPPLSSLLEVDKYGRTPLHAAIYSGNMEVIWCLMEAAPEAAYKMDVYGESPLYWAIKEGHDELVKNVLKVMPEASMSEATRSSLLTPNKLSLVHAAIRFRKSSLVKMILENIPSLIDSLDDKGWKPLSYGAYKGYLDEVHYMLNKFPASVKRCDSDGSFPIHKGVTGGHVSIIKAFISIHPGTLHSIDRKGRNILHIAVKYRKSDILCYLRDEVVGIEKLYNLRCNDGNTFADYAHENN